EKTLEQFARGRAFPPRRAASPPAPRVRGAVHWKGRRLTARKATRWACRPRRVPRARNGSGSGGAGLSSPAGRDRLTGFSGLLKPNQVQQGGKMFGGVGCERMAERYASMSPP